VTASRRTFLAAGLALPAASSAAAAPLAYKTLGKTGLKVTSVGFGCMITSDGSVVERAADLGITYFDTARSYQNGNNERMVGAALKRKRKDVVLSTKTEGGNKADALAQLDTSLKELGTDFVDIWYLHGRSTPAQITDDLVEAQQIAKKAGKIRFAGVSTHSGQRELIPFLAKHPQIDVILTQYNFTMPEFMNDVVEAAAKSGKGIVAMKVMAGGFRRGRGDERLHREGAMLAALKWAVKNPHIHTTIPSMTDMEQLDENLKAMSTPFGAADEKVLAAQMEHIAPIYCRMCGECDGRCKRGLQVADVLRYLTYAEGYGQFALGRERYAQLGPEQTAVRCADCGTCSVQCRYGVKVAHRMSRAQDVFAC
jgi:aryl-alcohol dehydrogenase-like predicted oxidoreductase